MKSYILITVLLTACSVETSGLLTSDAGSADAIVGTKRGTTPCINRCNTETTTIERLPAEPDAQPQIIKADAQTLTGAEVQVTNKPEIQVVPAPSDTLKLETAPPVGPEPQSGAEPQAGPEPGRDGGTDSKPICGFIGGKCCGGTYCNDGFYAGCNVNLICVPNPAAYRDAGVGPEAKPQTVPDTQPALTPDTLPAVDTMPCGVAGGTIAGANRCCIPADQVSRATARLACPGRHSDSSDLEPVANPQTGVCVCM